MRMTELGIPSKNTTFQPCVSTFNEQDPYAALPIIFALYVPAQYGTSTPFSLLGPLPQARFTLPANAIRCLEVVTTQIHCPLTTQETASPIS